MNPKQKETALINKFFPEQEVFEDKEGKSRLASSNFSEWSWHPTNSTCIWHQVHKLNEVHNGGKQELLSLNHYYEQVDQLPISILLTKAMFCFSYKSTVWNWSPFGTPSCLPQKVKYLEIFSIWNNFKLKSMV